MTTFLINSSAGVTTRPLVIHLPESLRLSEEDFYEFCQLNRELKVERTASGVILIGSPTGGETGSRNSEITAQLRFWSKRDGTGVAFDSSTGFILPNGAERSPDAAWVLRARLDQLSPESKRKFLPLCPDFVIELKSPSDSFEDLQAKMEEYIENGSQLGWLLVPDRRRIYVFCRGEAMRLVERVSDISGEPLLRGFTLDLKDVWNALI
jgi:Uma2 family endonuclease